VIAVWNEPDVSARWRREFRDVQARRFRYGETALERAEWRTGTEVGQQARDRFFEGVLQRTRKRGCCRCWNGNPRSFRRSKEEVNRLLRTAVERWRSCPCDPASYYRFDEKVGSVADSAMDLRDAVRRIALNGRVTDGGAHAGTAPPRLYSELERVYRLMREDNLLCVSNGSVVVTTDSIPDGSPSNLARQMWLTMSDHSGAPIFRYPASRRVRVSGFRSGCLLGERLIGWALERYARG